MTEHPVGEIKTDYEKVESGLQSDTFDGIKHLSGTLRLTTIILLTLFASLELVLRLGPVQPYVARMIPNLGSRHLQLEEQMARLERFAGPEKKVDCIFLGSSLVWLGINPTTFEEVYENETGQRVRCFNLGIEALPTNAAAGLAEVVVNKYRPWLLIYGTSARDYAIASSEEESRVVLETPWLRQELGDGTLWAWLETNSHTLKYIKEMGGLLLLDRHPWDRLTNASGLSQGFLAKTLPAQPVHFEAAVKDAVKWFQPYEIRRENVQGLVDIVRQQDKGSEVIVVEMPLNAQYYSYFQNGKEDYDRFLLHITSIASGEQAVLLNAPAVNVIPRDGWWDRSHMNIRGAEAFSRWMAQKIAHLVTIGAVSAPSATRGELAR